ncbi:hypothetical protein MSA03_06470 [Microbacterium saccharophilum]|nr:hypothetical protein MSA03_06470 [Microbacterium saccharophilum]
MSGDDGVTRATRWTAVAITPFLVIAAVLLFGFPDRTGELFAWAIAPPLSAYLLASAYAGGVWFFVSTTRARRWDDVKHGFPAVVVFAFLLLVATLLHLDRFSQNLSFAVWMTLYATTPVVVAALWLRESRRAGPPASTEGEVLVSRPVRTILVLVGGAAAVTGLALFLFPDAVIPVWAWELTPLTARVTGAVLTLTGVVNGALARDARWGAFRVLFQAQLISLIAIAISLVLGGGALAWERPAAAGFVALVGVALVLYGSVAWRYERLRRRARHPGASAAPTRPA